MGRLRVKRHGAPTGGKSHGDVIRNFEDLAEMLEGSLPAFARGARTRMTPAQRQSFGVVIQRLSGLCGDYLQVLTDAEADPGGEE